MYIVHAILYNNKLNINKLEYKPNIKEKTVLHIIVN